MIAGPSSDGEFELLDYILSSNKHLQPIKARSKVWVEDFKSELGYASGGQFQKDLSDHLPIWGHFEFEFTDHEPNTATSAEAEVPTMQSNNIDTHDDDDDMTVHVVVS